jgi:hypothetical protein
MSRRSARSGDKNAESCAKTVPSSFENPPNGLSAGVDVAAAEEAEEGSDDLAACRSIQGVAALRYSSQGGYAPQRIAHR